MNDRLFVTSSSRIYEFVLRVNAVNDAPTLTSVNTLTGATEDTAFTITYAKLAEAANEADVDGDTISFRVEGVSSGTLTKNGTPVVMGGTLLGSGESLVWTPLANANGTLNAFTVKAWDGQAASSSAVQVSVSVAAVNDAPIGANNAVTTLEDTAYTFAAADFGFSDPNDNPANAFQAVKITTLPAAGSLTLNGTAVNAGDLVSLNTIVNTVPVGASWTARESNRGWECVASSADGTKLVAVVDGGQIYTSTDSGVTWTARESNRRWSKVASSSDGTKLVAVVNEGQIYTSTDSGVNWTARESNRTWRFVASSSDGTKLVAGVFNGLIYTSTDSGVNWTARGIDPHVINGNWLFHSGASSSDGTKLVAGVWGGRIYTSTDSGVTWTARESSRNWVSIVSSADGTKLAAVDLSGRIYTSTDSGATWTARESNREWNSVASSADGTKLVAAVYNGGQLYTSTDSGVTWTARESNRLWYSVASSADGAKLVAGERGGRIYTSSAADGLVFTPGANVSGSPYATFTFQVQDDGGTTNGAANLDPSPKTLTIHVTSVSDAPTFVKGPDQSVLEDSGPQSVPNWATGISAGPMESGQTLSFIVSADNNALFAMQPEIEANGTLTYTPANNAHGIATVSVNLKDNGGTANGGVDTSPTQTFTITVLPVNDSPTISNIADQSINEDSSISAIAFSVGDIETATGALTLTASSSNPALALIGNIFIGGSGANRTVAITPTANQHGVATITITVSDGSLTASDSFVLTVNPVNDAPAGANNSVTTLEDTAYTFAAADFGFSDPNDNPANAFQAVKITTLPSAGTLTSGGTAVNAGDFVPLTMPAGATWTARESNRDWQSLASSADGTKLVAGVYGGQIYTSTDSGVTWTAREGNRNWQSVASSADGTKLVAGVSGGQIYTSTDSGVIWTSRESNRNWTSVASSSDGTKLVAGVSGEQIYTSTDSGVIWTPRENGRSWQSVASSSDGTKLVAVVSGGQQIYTSTDSGVTWTARESIRNWNSVTSSSDGTKLVAVMYGGQIYTSSAMAGLVFIPAANANGSPYTTFTFQVQDDGGTANGGANLDPSPNTMTIHVTPVNSFPTISNIADQNINEDSTTGTISFTVADGETPATNLTLSASSSNTALVPIGNIVFGGSGTDRTVTVTPVTNQHGVTIITVTVSDGSLSASDSFVVTVNAVNDAPTFAKGADEAVMEDAGPQIVTNWAIAISAGPPDESGQSLSFHVTSDNTALFSVPPAISSTGTLSYTPAPNANGVATVIVGLNDDGGSASGGVDRTARQFTVVVNPVNDAPVASPDAYATNEDQVLVVPPRGLLANDSDVEGDALSAMLVSAPSHGFVNLNPDGSFRYTPVPNFNGADSFTYKAKDATLESAATVVALVINPVNDPPAVNVSQTSITTTEGTSVSNEISFGDIDGDAVSLTASLGSIVSENGRSIWRFQAVDGPLSTQVSITADDGHGGTAAAAFNLTVNNVAPTVTILGPSAGSVYSVNTPINFAGSFTDPGVNDTHTANWTFNAAGVPDVTVSGTVSGRAVQDTLQFSTAGIYFATLTVTDKDGGSGAATTVNGSAAYIVVFDPNGGFVTGGGWINSPPGALTTDVSSQGKATFGFTAKYPGKKSIPDGNVEFQFQPAKLNFKSSTIDWLVVSVNRAQLKGSGTINQRDGVEFMLTAVDAPSGNGGGSDRFRLQIWDKASGTVIYDNQPGGSINAQLDDNAFMAGGNITIHK